MEKDGGWEPESSTHHRLCGCSLRLASPQPWCRKMPGHHRWLLLPEEGGIFPGKYGPRETVTFRDRWTAPLGERLLRCQPAWHSGNAGACGFKGQRNHQMFGENTSAHHTSESGLGGLGEVDVSEPGHQAVNTGRPLAKPALLLPRCGCGASVLSHGHRLTQLTPRGARQWHQGLSHAVLARVL